MNSLVYLVSILLYWVVNASSFDPGFLRSPQKPDNNSSSEYPPLCDDAPSTNIDPEKCCHFPNFFDDSVVQKCEEENGLTDKTIVGDMVSDSVSLDYFWKD